MNSGIYALVNKQNGKRYIGRTVDFTKRKQMHFWSLKNNRHQNIHLQRAWNQGQRFDFEIIERCEPDKCDEREIYWIDFFDSMDKDKGYNLCEGGHTTSGYCFTEEAKDKISKANAGRKFSPEVIAKRSNSLKKHIAEDPEFAERIKQRCRTQLHGGWNKGMKTPEETRKKLSKALKGRYVSLEHKEKLRDLYSGEKSISAKLKTSDVVNIRYRFLCGERQRDILKDYPQITPQTIYDIVRNRRWHSVPNDKESLEKMMEVQYGKTS